jgi:hypothetical protein
MWLALGLSSFVNRSPRTIPVHTEGADVMVGLFKRLAV